MSQGIEREASPAGGGNHDGSEPRRLTRGAPEADRSGRRARRHHRPGLRRAAAGPGLLRPRDRRPGLRRRLRQGRAAPAGRELHQAHPRRGHPGGCARASSRPRSDFRRLDEPDVIIICVPTPLTDSRDPDLTYVVNSAAVDRRAAAARPARGPREHHLPGHDPRGRPAAPGRRAGSSRASTSSWPSAPSARTRAIPSSRPPPSPRSSAASTRPASSSPPPSTARWSSGSSPSPAPRSPRPARSSRTPTAPSTSRWSTN